MSRQSAFIKECPGCGGPVHVRAKMCKACGGPSPWKTESGPEIISTTNEIEKISEDQPIAVKVDEPAPIAPKVVHSASIAALPPPKAVRAAQYVAAEKFSTVYADQFITFARFQEIPEHMVSAMLEQDQPIVDSEQVDTILACPHCKRLFTPAKKRAARNAA